MPYWSITEWRARIGSSWCALGRPFKMRSPFRGRIRRASTLSQGLTMTILLIMSIGVNLGLRVLVARGYHLPLFSKCNHSYCTVLVFTNQIGLCISCITGWFKGATLPDKMYLINLGLTLTLVIQIISALVYQLLSMAIRCSKSFSSDLTESLSFSTCFVYYSIFFILKMINPLFPIHWLILIGRGCSE